LAHLAASVFIGSMLSHFKQTSFVRPVLSVIAINRFLQLVQRLKSIVGSGARIWGDHNVTGELPAWALSRQSSDIDGLKASASWLNKWKIARPISNHQRT
jgi:hypothetical protein